VPESLRTRDELTAPAHYAQSEPRVPRRLIVGCALRVVVTTCSLLAIYLLLPLEGFGGSPTLAYLLLGTAIYAGAMVWQLRAILIAEHPGLRAVETIGVVLPLLVILFAIVYVSMAVANPLSFSEPLSKVAGLYFTITVLATVGFGDITPKTDAARLIVSLQMLLDLVLVGVIAKLIISAARTGMERRHAARQDDHAVYQSRS
jgi:hypothetical protein